MPGQDAHPVMSEPTSAEELDRCKSLPTSPCEQGKKQCISHLSLLVLMLIYKLWNILKHLYLNHGHHFTDIIYAFNTELFSLVSVSELAELESIRKALSFGQEHKSSSSSSSSSVATVLQGTENEGHENGDVKSVQSKRMSLEHFSFIKVLGKGSFGKVGS